MRFIKFCALIAAIAFICIAGAATGARALQCDSCEGPQKTKLPMQFLFCDLTPGTQYIIKLDSGGGCPRDKDCYVFHGMRMCCEDVPY